MKQAVPVGALVILATIFLSALPALAQEPALIERADEGEQSRESMANDATAAQWTLQVAYEVRDWYEDWRWHPAKVPYNFAA